MKNYVLVLSYPGTDREPTIEKIKSEFSERKLILEEWAEKAFYGSEEDISDFFNYEQIRELYIHLVAV